MNGKINTALCTAPRGETIQHKKVTPTEGAGHKLSEFTVLRVLWFSLSSSRREAFVIAQVSYLIWLCRCGTATVDCHPHSAPAGCTFCFLFSPLSFFFIVGAGALEWQQLWRVFLSALRDGAGEQRVDSNDTLCLFFRMAIAASTVWCQAGCLVMPVLIWASQVRPCLQ